MRYWVVSVIKRFDEMEFESRPPALFPWMKVEVKALEEPFYYMPVFTSREAAITWNNGSAENLFEMQDVAVEKGAVTEPSAQLDFCFICGHVCAGHGDYNRKGDGSVDHDFVSTDRAGALAAKQGAPLDRGADVDNAIRQAWLDFQNAQSRLYRILTAVAGTDIRDYQMFGHGYRAGHSALLARVRALEAERARYQGLIAAARALIDAEFVARFDKAWDRLEQETKALEALTEERP